MKAGQATGASAAVALEARERRRRRAAAAARLVAGAPEALAELDWDALDQAPAWLSLPDPALATVQRQIGALLHAPQIRLWIDGPRLGAARGAVGEAFLQALLAQPEAPPLPGDVAARVRFTDADQVRTQLQIAGASVLLASLPQGPLRRAVAAAMAPTAASPMADELARSMVARVQALSAPAAAREPAADRAQTGEPA